MPTGVAVTVETNWLPSFTGLPLMATITSPGCTPAWLATPETLWAPWLLQGRALQEGLHDAVVLALRDQETAGIDIVTDGEQTRRHFVWGFVEQVDDIMNGRLPEGRVVLYDDDHYYMGGVLAELGSGRHAGQLAEDRRQPAPSAARNLRSSPAVWDGRGEE